MEAPLASWCKLVQVEPLHQLRGVTLRIWRPQVAGSGHLRLTATAVAVLVHRSMSPPSLRLRKELAELRMPYLRTCAGN